MERLQKYLAECGITSRRKCEQHIISGHVKVNGNVIKELGVKIEPDVDIVEFDGKIVKRKTEFIYIMLNKPTGYITSVKDQFSRPTVLDLINISERIYPVGRLDYNTSGLLILTNDGELTNILTHPKHDVVKTYIAEIKGIPDEGKITRFKSGLKIDNYMTSNANIKIIDKKISTSIVEIKIHEGRNRQVRKMCDAIGHPVITLKRTKIGDLSLNGLDIGRWRFLNNKEIEYLKNLR